MAKIHYSFISAGCFSQTENLWCTLNMLFFPFAAYKTNADPSYQKDKQTLVLSFLPGFKLSKSKTNAEPGSTPVMLVRLTFKSFEQNVWRVNCSFSTISLFLVLPANSAETVDTERSNSAYTK